MSVDKDIVAKIKKLFAMAADKANENEASVALEMAHNLMRKHGIDAADVDDFDNATLDVNGWQSDYLSQVDTYSRVLAQAAAKLFNCEQWLVRTSAANKYRVKMCFAGEVTDVELCKEIWPYLVKMAKRMATNYAGSGWQPKHRAFAEAFALRIHKRAEEMSAVQAQVPSGKPVSDDEKYALVVMKKEQAVQKWFDQNNIKIKITTRALRGRTDADAIYAGDKAGNQVNLNFRRQVGANTPTHMLGN